MGIQVDLIAGCCLGFELTDGFVVVDLLILRFAFFWD